MVELSLYWYCHIIQFINQFTEFKKTWYYQITTAPQYHSKTIASAPTFPHAPRTITLKHEEAYIIVEIVSKYCF